MLSKLDMNGASLKVKKEIENVQNCLSNRSFAPFFTVLSIHPNDRKLYCNAINLGYFNTNFICSIFVPVCPNSFATPLKFPSVNCYPLSLL